MATWGALQAAVDARDWEEAGVLARAFADEWDVIRSWMVLFAGEGAEAWAEAVDEVFAGLLGSLEAQSVSAEAVDEVMVQAQVFVAEDTGESTWDDGVE